MPLAQFICSERTRDADCSDRDDLAISLFIISFYLLITLCNYSNVIKINFIYRSVHNSLLIINYKRYNSLSAI